MKLSDFKKNLGTINEINFVQPNNEIISSHFHITEVGLTTKFFIDCGGSIREEKVVNFQLWEANDTEHRLVPQKLLNIIDISEKSINIGDWEVEIEYQVNTIGRYGLEFDGKKFILTNKKTNCLASDKCGIPSEKLKMNLSELQNEKQNCCTPTSGCCN